MGQAEGDSVSSMSALPATAEGQILLVYGIYIETWNQLQMVANILNFQDVKNKSQLTYFEIFNLKVMAPYWKLSDTYVSSS